MDTAISSLLDDVDPAREGRSAPNGKTGLNYRALASAVYFSARAAVVESDQRHTSSHTSWIRDLRPDAIVQARM